MPTRNIDFTDRHDQFVEEQVRTGKFGDIDEVVRAGLRLLQQQDREEQEKLAVLRRLTQEGIEQIDLGAGIRLRGADEVSDYISKLGERAAAELRQSSAG